MARDILKLVVAVLVCEGAGGIGSIATMRSVSTWYQTLQKPAFSPPSWLFGPVWTILYLLMGVAAWLVWRKGLGDPTVRTALILFIIQLALNTAWSFIFFGARQPGLAFAELIVLWVAILLTMIWFLRVSTAAGLLLAPYILWVTFAGALNFEIWRLNR